MSGYRVALLAGLLPFVVAGSASAQDERRVGLVLGAPLQVGLLWQATDRMAVRPGVSASSSSSDFGASVFPAGYTSETASARVSVGAALLLYLTEPAADLRTYLAPRYGFSRSRVTTRSSLSLPLPELPLSELPPGLLPEGLTENQSRNTQINHEGGLSFGVEQAIGSRFRLFGEVGVAFATSSSTSTLSDIESSGKGAGTTGGVGVVWMF